MSNLSVTLIQPDIQWENISGNLEALDRKLADIGQRTELIILPEMFSTGFSMDPKRLAEPMNGSAVQWMLRKSSEMKAALTGSLIITEDGQFFNRLIWALPDGTTGTYDKRHLFSPGGESGPFTRGTKKLVGQLKGWRICLNICYDLRFPAWVSNQGGDQYDVLVYVANWPGKRNLAWNTLLQARAIENQCYVIGVNRVGTDGLGEFHGGNSAIIGPTGEILCRLDDREEITTMDLSQQSLRSAREHFPFLKDGDRFLLT